VLQVKAPDKVVTIRRTHFANGKTKNGGSAILHNSGTLTLQSCIFSGNQAPSSGSGGALFNQATLVVQGCTFYANTATYQGGVLYNEAGSATFTGNIFFANTASTSADGNVVYLHGGSVTSNGYNLYSEESAGFTFGSEGDKKITLQPFVAETFKPEKNGEANGVLPTSLPAGYPTKDFYGDTITQSSATGAVQEWIVATNPNNDGVGSFRWAIAKALGKGEGSTVYLAPTLSSGVLALGASLPTITKSLTIRGSNATVSGCNAHQIIHINAPGKTVNICRLHFFNGKAASYGGAVRNEAGRLNLQSCVFSENKVTANSGYGGAIYNEDILSVMGCTFFGNVTPYRGSAIYQQSGTTAITGNIFYGNTAGENGSITYSGGGLITSGGYNVYDHSYGFSFGANDRQAVKPVISPVSFRLLTGSEAAGVLPANSIAGYPTKDFYGNDIPTGSGASGAAQGNVNAGVALHYGSYGPGRVDTFFSAVANSDGLFASGSSVAIRATPAEGATLLHWLVNGVETKGSGLDNACLLVKLEDHKSVKALFAYVVNSLADNTNTEDGYTTLREAIIATNGSYRSGITFSPALSGDTIKIASPLPGITKSLMVEGNGVTIAAKGAHRIMEVSAPNVDVTFRSLHLAGGRAESEGGALRHSAGDLRLQSCILSNNSVTASGSALGGAIYSAAKLSLQGCTFYNNTTPYQGGAVYVAASGSIAAVVGNIFYENTATSSGGAIYNAGAAASSGGYNVHSGTLSGFAFGGTGDVAAAALPFDSVTFRPAAAAQGILPATLSASYPLRDFYGGSIGGSGAAGAAQVATTPALFTPTPKPSGTVYVVDKTSDKSSSPETGSLRWAITQANKADNGCIYVDPSLAGNTITLVAALPAFTKTTTMEGNGITISGDNKYPFIEVKAQSKTIRIHRVHFTKGCGSRFSDELSYSQRSVIFNQIGTLILGSCIFSNTRQDVYSFMTVDSDNRSSSRIAITKTFGCTFYNNSPSGRLVEQTFGPVEGQYGHYNTGDLFYKNNTQILYAVNHSGNIRVDYDTYIVYDKMSAQSFAQIPIHFSTGLKHIENSPLVTSNSFQLLNREAYILHTQLPADYPTKDFYGNPVEFGAAAGAVQSMAAAYPVIYAACGNGTIAVSSSSPATSDGLYTPGSVVTLTPTPGQGSTLLGWVVNGVEKKATGRNGALLITVNEAKDVRAMFACVVNTTADNTNNDGLTSLREAIHYINAQADSSEAAIYGITFAPELKGQTITLTSALPRINRNIIIDGGGITISGDNKYPIIQNYYITATIRDVHFTNANSTDKTGAITMNCYGALNLQSCIFSNNRGKYGGAVGGNCVNSGIINVQGCTFYNNHAEYGGAIASFSRRGFYTGNIFFGNTADTEGNIIYSSTMTYSSFSTDSSGGYNVYDNTGNKGITFNSPGDRLVAASAKLFKDTISFRLKRGSVALGLLPAALPAGYPERDIYGSSISGGGAAGAVQSGASIVITTNDAGLGSLREVITQAEEGDTVRFDPSLVGDTITLASPITIDKSLAIEGCGITVSGNDAHQIFSISAAAGKTISFSRLHFTKGRIYGVSHGSAIRNGQAAINLQSCIFSRNTADISDGSGGAVYSDGALSVQGCTFYANKANTGGAIYATGPASITGNIFYDNTADYGEIIYATGSAISGGYNVYSGLSEGFTFSGTGDRQTGQKSPFKLTTFAPTMNSEARDMLAAIPAGYPTADYYGNPIYANGAAGAVQVNIVVTNTNDEGPGSLRQAMLNVMSLMDEGETILLDSSLAGKTIALRSSLPLISKKVTIEGGGVKLSGENACQIMEVSTSDTVAIQRLHFAGGRSIDYGSAVRHTSGSAGVLNLQSCIFTGNHVPPDAPHMGGALYNAAGTLNVQGCTFYSNGAYRGEAIYQASGVTNLAGNIFYGHISNNSGSVIYSGGGTINSIGYNVYDESTDFTFNGTDDKQVLEQPFETKLFAPLMMDGGGARNALTDIPYGYPPYPEVDFYGKDVNAHGASGAVQIIRLEQTPPAAPTLRGKTADSIALNDMGTNIQYRLGATGKWQNSPCFGGLTPNTTYTFYARKKGNNDYEPSPASAPSNPFTTDKARLTGTVAILGVDTVGNTLSANTSGLTSDPIGATMGTLSYRWKRNGKFINGATSNHYLLAQADVNQQITVTVTAANMLDSVTSLPRAISKASLRGTVAILGVDTVGNTLRADTTKLSSKPLGVSIGALSYRWKRNGKPMGGATSNHYLLVQADANQQITVTEIGRAHV
jgi:CSLREA domain-containing protein